MGKCYSGSWPQKMSISAIILLSTIWKTVCPLVSLSITKTPNLHSSLLITHFATFMLFCLFKYLHKNFMDFHLAQNHLKYLSLPHLLVTPYSTPLTFIFNIEWVNSWPPIFPWCTGDTWLMFDQFQEYECQLVKYQTPFNALKPGDYIKCVEDQFKVKLQ